ncbi:hypothetical protein [Lapidilactobacillus wuchangensis]|uniref:hypothetical protein n=1 Tax=Lapidilactobacillus wuchangensis TaxID=2486001 RepID=UPI000F786055|nr:hypothetical protein [Lapidilactobacillus wuchangensis]
MALIKIFKGIENGPEAIDDNFNFLDQNKPNKTDVESKVDISIWHNEPMRNGFTGSVHWRVMKFASSDAKLVEIIATVGNLAGNSGKYLCDFPAELVPAREIPLNWAQSRNNDFDKVGVSLGGEKTSLRLNFTVGGPSNLSVDIHQMYWTDLI